MKPYAMTARIGYTNLDEADGSQDLRLGTAKLHPHYNSSNYYADIAILKLQQPVQFSTRLQPCCLPDARDNTGRIGTSHVNAFFFNSIFLHLRKTPLLLIWGAL